MSLEYSSSEESDIKEIEGNTSTELNHRKPARKKGLSSAWKQIFEQRKIVRNQSSTDENLDQNAKLHQAQLTNSDRQEFTHQILE
jgi:hypothetical protein